ncbi:putative pheromone a factor receptor [Clavispora lusitaniae]|uniref:Pheromone a factor receptor n=2 Tax=Clavispora lusitaniae TaxID=36911 RepID=C4Y460_CLAL4|nr:uncharacterized protein CLUG_02432 [Clavispora lusitaniae ATCC 42720]KAF5211441.1 a-factor receptor [Clavispora lusitaniae]EEQ38306.1 hypothetical protein CLUG_02432 [Clavispora lusitaniae ATCC 42720]KAF7580294.1 Pheromone A receptor family protein [Clavispora lusitaniae]QFZ27860.1 putative pheromone a factor receptor [Clavispora lusitaniae]QFZ32833.1 putative pheromone a factor receptor [Clavispora lusitaniae]
MTGINSTGSAIAGFSFIGLCLLIPPLFYHIRFRNIPACTLIFWLCFKNLVSFVNAVIWSKDDFYTATKGKGYCDVTVRIASGSASGELLAISCLMFNLYMIISARSQKFLDNKSNRKVLINLAMCWGLPLIITGISVAVQSTRYVIFRYRGCSAIYYPSYWYIVCVSIWTPVCALIGLIFAILTMTTFFLKRRDIKDILRCTNSGLNLRRFARLIIFSLLIIFAMVPLALYNFITSVNQLRHTNATWTIERDPHWSDILAIDAGTSQLAPIIIDICLSFCTFVLFGLGSDALALYKRLFVVCGFSSFKSKSKQEFKVSEHFAGNKQSTRNTVDSEMTEVTSTKKVNKSKGLVSVKTIDSKNSDFTLSNTTPNDLEMGSYDDYEIERIIRGDIESDPQMEFEFKVIQNP